MSQGPESGPALPEDVTNGIEASVGISLSVLLVSPFLAFLMPGLEYQATQPVTTGKSGGHGPAH